MQPTAKQTVTRDLYNILSTEMLQKTLDNDNGGYSCFSETEAMRLCELLRWKQQQRHIMESRSEMYSSDLPTKLFREILMFYGET